MLFLALVVRLLSGACLLASLRPNTHFWGTFHLSFTTCPLDVLWLSLQAQSPDFYIHLLTCSHSHIIPTCWHTCLSFCHQPLSVYNQLTCPFFPVCLKCASLLWMCLLCWTSLSNLTVSSFIWMLIKWTVTLSHTHSYNRPKNHRKNTWIISL